VLGALHEATERLNWESKAKFLILIGDAPAHGKECTNDPSDRFKDGRGVTVKETMDKLKAREIHLMFCRIKEKYTKRMEERFKLCYNDDQKGFELKTVDLFDADKEQDGSFHFIFVLDESGSMGGT